MALLGVGCASYEVREIGGGLPSWVAVLGAAQDAGRPQAGCREACCGSLGMPARVASLGLRGTEGWLLVDATPDLPEQTAAMGSMPAAILLTHAHIGHYAGLVHLGFEAAATDRMPIWCTARMAQFLTTNAPWSALVEQGHIVLVVLDPGSPFEPIPGLSVTSLTVPHRDEYTDTVGFSVARDGQRILYVPDIDSWDLWGQDVSGLAVTHDALILDGTFFSGDELPHRPLAEVPHPVVRRTMDRLQDVAGKVWFTHLNHTNPLWDPTSAAWAEVTARGFNVAVFPRQGRMWQ